jgi:GntR family transcriptional regulator/MocR family aminotransferase
MISFRTGVPDLKSIPVARWGKLYREIALSVPPEKLDYQRPFGEPELRRQLSMYLRRVRGVNAAPDDILIVNGAAQAFSLISRFVPESGYALVENPLSYGILHTLQGNGVRVRAVPVDECGMKTNLFPDEPPGLIFTTPSHQFPTGVILPVQRRIEMIRYAEKHAAYIVEDDYDSEFRFDGSPIQSIQQLSPDRVIYVGTFSKTLMPALRIGYVALPAALRARMEEIKYTADLHSPVLEQLTLAKFIETGLFDRHIRKMRGVYLARRNLLIACLREAFGDGVIISGAGAGMHLVAAFRGVRFDDALLKSIGDAGVQISAVSRHYLREEGGNGVTPFDDSLIFGYGNTSPEAIREGVERLRAVIP